MSVTASAPGKLFLLGEYAVLHGAPALMSAVNRRVQVEIEAIDSKFCEVLAPDICAGPARFRCSANGTCEWEAEPAGSRLGLVTAVVTAFGRRGWLPEGAWRARLDSSRFFLDGVAGRTKLGLGSSAAITVALASALATHAGHGKLTRDRSHWLRELLEIHRGFQGGRGSGADVAAALYGGEIVFFPHAELPRVQPFEWPAAVPRVYVWSGYSASTTQLVAGLEAWGKTAPRRHAKRIETLKVAGELGAAAARAGNEDWMYTAVGDMAKGLRKLSHGSKIPIFSDAHEAIAATVRAAGGIYKPCGAGGGDLGMAVIHDADGRQALMQRLAADGHQSVDLMTDAAGLVVESAPETE